MPIYEYKCKKCGAVVERIQKFTDPPLRRHQGCGGTLSKLISQSSFQLKGSGWYVTDYARKPAKAAAGGGDGKNGGSTADSKGDDAVKTDSSKETSKNTGDDKKAKSDDKTGSGSGAEK